MESLFNHFRSNLYNIGGPRFDGLYSPEDSYDVRTKAGVTEQFIDDADTYHQRYTSRPGWTRRIREAFDHVAVRGPVHILDVGSGSGNTVFPILDLLPESHIVATDISPDLLAILNRSLSADQRSRCLLVAMNASDDVLVPDTFDLAVGGAILHHIIDPRPVIESTMRALKPGGYAIFYEPFESGSAILRLAYRMLLRRKFQLGINAKVAQLIEGIVYDFEIRTGTDKSNDIFNRIDDKWVFTRTYFERIASAIGCRVHGMYSIDDRAKPFSNKLLGHLRVGLDLGPEAIPQRAWTAMEEYDHLMSPDLLQEVFVEGCIILAK